MKTPEEIVAEALDGLGAYQWRPGSNRRDAPELIEALNAAGYVIVTRAKLQMLRDSFPTADYHDQAPGT